jgi:dephospho-CoA kinase
MKIIGLTGGIATGKTTVARFLEELGAVVIDADQLARDVVAPGSPALAKIVELFGSAVLAPDGSLGRQAVRGLVFGDQLKRKQLEAIMHPAIKVVSEQRLAAVKARGAAVAVYMAPLLIEAGATDRVDEIWVVTLRPEVQLARLMARDNCSREQAGQIIAAQMPLTEKEGYGVVVIDNSGSLETTREQVRAAWQQRIAV